MNASDMIAKFIEGANDQLNSSDLWELAEIQKAVTELQDRANELSALEYAGVDNWSGYWYKMEMLEENFPETYTRMYG